MTKEERQLNAATRAPKSTADNAVWIRELVDTIPHAFPWCCFGNHWFIKSPTEGQPMVCVRRMIKWIRLKKKIDEGNENVIVVNATVDTQANRANLPRMKSAMIPENIFPTIEPTAPQANISPSCDVVSMMSGSSYIAGLRAPIVFRQSIVPPYAKNINARIFHCWWFILSPSVIEQPLVDVSECNRSTLVRRMWVRTRSLSFRSQFNLCKSSIVS